MSLTACDLIRKTILDQLVITIGEYEESGSPIKGPFDSHEKIEAAITDLDNAGLSDYYYEAESDARHCYTHETPIEPDSCGHYESKSVATEIDGQWVGWTYWYGGGKHGEPSLMEWLGDAYFLDCCEEMRVVQVFTKID